MTALLQTHSRDHKIPIDELAFRTTVTEYETPSDLDGPPEAGTYTHGYFIEGARWNREACEISESRRGELQTAVPIVVLEPTTRAVLASDEVVPYKCPCYKVSTRQGTLSTT